MNLLDLPIDVLFLVFPYLDVPSFVSLTRTCKSLHDPHLSQDSHFWSVATRSTFRVPNQPVVEHDGRRWRKLYQRLMTQSRVYTWGSNAKGNLGHSYESMERLQRFPPAMRRRHAMRARHISWPTEMEGYRELGIISDLQSGGWSTTLLTAKGALHCVGVMDGINFIHRQPPFMQTVKPRLTRLQYPPGYSPPSDRYEPTTAIKQFSAGRAHVLGLSDSGRIWSWNNIEHAALNVKFLDVDLTEGGNASSRSTVKKVVAGWNKSAALISKVGIVLWDPLSRTGEESEEEDTVMVLQTAVVPQTSHQRQSSSDRDTMDSSASGSFDIGEVLNFVLLENFVLFNTHIGRVFAAHITWNNTTRSIDPIFEVPLSTDSNPLSQEAPQDQKALIATDVQGSFRNFAVFAKDGIVFNGHQDYLDNLTTHINNRERAIENPLVRIPALQNKDVIALSFGDYHFLALHSNGRITSYGQELEGCGAFGLGGGVEGRLRGIRYSGFGGTGRLVPHAYTTGREVWFEPEKQDWICFLVSGAKDPEEAMERIRMCADNTVQAEVSEWIEQEGRAWEEKFGALTSSSTGSSAGVSTGTSTGASVGAAVGVSTSEEETQETGLDSDNLGAYFALSVTAAGWHSGALVLVNDDLAAQIREGCLIRSETKPVTALQSEEPIASTETEEASQSPTGYIYSTLTWTFDTLRWALGLSTAAATDNANSQPVSPQNPEHFTNPINHGAAVDAETKYKWAEDSFPRLKLADGREMPGRVEFDEWRKGRPEWDLTFTRYE